MTARLDYQSVPCGLCEARIGETCRTVTGGRARYAHTIRRRAVDAAWRVGFREGLILAVENPVYARRQVNTWADDPDD